MSSTDKNIKTDQASPLTSDRTASESTAQAGQEMKSGLKHDTASERKSHPFTNRLSESSSPYLLQHQHNPVDWYPWCDEAIEKARKESKVIFLSIGYSTCHWCHVMADESFDDPKVAEVMNKHFVNIKVDREERPDLDSVYMAFITSIHGSGGWPLNVFIDPFSLGPFTGGTYFPPVPKFGSQSFTDVLNKVAQMWSENRETILEASESVVDIFKKRERDEDKAIDKPKFISTEMFSYQSPSRDTIDLYFTQLSRMYDHKYGGFGKSPKFPQPSLIEGLLAHVMMTKSRDGLHMCEHTLKQILEGGIHDHLGGGFHRYSVSEDWLLPHFEKMLYDQSQLIRVYLSLFAITKNPLYENIARKTINYVFEEMTSKDGHGFYSAEDADSLESTTSTKKKEGAFYVWDKSEIVDVLSRKDIESGMSFSESDIKVFCLYYGIEEEGNVPESMDTHMEFMGKNILHISMSMDEISSYMNLQRSEVEDTIEGTTKRLLTHRSQRHKPHLDDKVIVSWNAMMISSLIHAYNILGDSTYLKKACETLNFIRNNLYLEKEGYLLRVFRRGKSGSVRAFAIDYATLIGSLIDVYEAGFDMNYLMWAIELQSNMIELFYDENNDGFFEDDKSDPHLFSRTKVYQDQTEPSSNSLSVINLLRLSQITNNHKYEEYALRTFESFKNEIDTSPIICPYMMHAIRLMEKKMNIIVRGKDEDADDMVRYIQSMYEPAKTVVLDKGEENILREWGIEHIETDGVQVYICEAGKCNMPVSKKDDVKRLMMNK